MPYPSWIYAAMEEAGDTDTPDGRINRIANYLAQSPNAVIEEDEFLSACAACHIPPHSFTQRDVERIQQKLNGS